MQYIRRYFSIVAVASLFLFSACNDDSDDMLDPLVVPDEYDGSVFQASAADELATLTRLKALRDKAFEGRAGNEVLAADLNSLYQVGTPSLKSQITAFYGGKIEGTDGYFAQLEKGSGNTYTLGNTASDGGTFGGYLFNQYGVEMEQLIEKGMFASVLYNQAVELMTGELDNTTTDKVLALFGANPDFPNSNDGTKHTVPDRYAASYVARRDKNDGNGLYSAIELDFRTLQAAIKAGDQYAEQQDEAIQGILENWEKGLAATVVFYLNDVITKLSETSPTDVTKGAALHALSESIGFMQGFKTISDDHKIITDSQIDELLWYFNAPANGTASSYKFATDPLNELGKLDQAIDKIQSVYGFSNAQMEDFKSNWVAIQQR